MHSVLARQLRKLGLDASTAPATDDVWRQFIARVDRFYTDADQDRYTLERSLELSSGEMQDRLSQLHQMQAKLLEASRRAGMAEVAANVIHNVGNVLNSVNVSASVIARVVGSTTSEGAHRAVSLLRSQPHPGRFLDEDPRGGKLLAYLEQIAERLRSERDEALAELDALTKNIDHIKAIIGQQQSQTRSTAIIERVALTELLDDGVKSIGCDNVANRPVEIVRDYRDPLVVEIDRHKAYQVVVNLLTNARDAVRTSERPPRIVLRTRSTEQNRVVIEVEDNGVGIAPENLRRIFNHGFTTKPHGHGFGLHSSSCSAMELGGKLVVQSDGPGRGAIFRLTLPRAHAATNPSPCEPQHEPAKRYGT